jgi:hypothetical protein
MTSGSHLPPDHVAWKVATAYLLLLVAAALAAAGVGYYFWSARVESYQELLLAALHNPEKFARLELAALAEPVAMVGAAVLGTVVSLLLARRKSAGLVLMLVAALCALATLYVAYRGLTKIEREHDEISSYLRLYRLGALPLAFASVVAPLVVLVSWLRAR